MDKRAVIDEYKRLHLDLNTYRSIMGNGVSGNSFNEMRQVDDVLQVVVASSGSDLLCLNTEGGITLINSTYQQGRDAQLPLHIGRVVYIVMWTYYYDTLSFVNEAYHLYHIRVSDLIADINSNRVSNIPDNADPFSVVSIEAFFPSRFANRLHWIDDHGYLNCVTQLENQLVNLSTKDPISPRPVRLRHGYMIDEEEGIFEITGDITYSRRFRYDDIISDIAKSYPSVIISILNNEGLIEDYFDDGEYSNTIENIIIDKFVNERQLGMCIVRDDDVIIIKSTGGVIKTPGRLFLMDELSRLDQRIKSAIMDPTQY